LLGAETLKRLVLPRLYVILDSALLTTPETECAQGLAAAGVRMLQYRNKTASVRELLETATRLNSILPSSYLTFVVNDRADVAYLSGAHGVHVGQEDLGVEAARAILGPRKLIGVSTHNREQFLQAVTTSADYIAVGPVFSTSTKGKPDPVVGTNFLQEVRPLTDKSIVAIGGITLERAAEVIQAGADSVAVISDILHAPDPANRARQFLDLLEDVPRVAGQ